MEAVHEASPVSGSDETGKVLALGVDLREDDRLHRGQRA
jgi:hypothetical protein